MSEVRLTTHNPLILEWYERWKDLSAAQAAFNDAARELREKGRWLLKLADSTEVPKNTLDDAIRECSDAVDKFDAADAALREKERGK